MFIYTWHLNILQQQPDETVSSTEFVIGEIDVWTVIMHTELEHHQNRNRERDSLFYSTWSLSLTREEKSHQRNSIVNTNCPNVLSVPWTSSLVKATNPFLSIHKTSHSLKLMSHSHPTTTTYSSMLTYLAQSTNRINRPIDYTSWRADL